MIQQYTVNPEILAVIKFGDLPETWQKLLAEFKFGGLLCYVIAYISLYAILTISILII